MRFSSRHKHEGFTLIEAIIAIVITGILVGMVSVFISKPVQGYFDAVRRAELTDAADVALRRMTRDVRLALPNSLRQTSATSFEFIMTKAGGRYRHDADGSPCPGSGCLFSDSSGFDVVGPIPLLQTGDLIVAYNLGEGYAPADAYANPSTNVATVGTGTLTANPIPLSANPFTASSSLSSPGNRFQVVAAGDKVVRYTCAGGILTRDSGCTLDTPSDCSSPATSSRLAGSADGKPSASCTIDYTAAAAGLKGLLYVELKLTDTSGEAITLFQQIHVDNAP